MLAMTRANTLNMAVNHRLISWDTTFCCCQVWWLLVLRKLGTNEALCHMIHSFAANLIFEFSWYGGGYLCRLTQTTFPIRTFSQHGRLLSTVVPWAFLITYRREGWLRGSAVERRCLAGELSLSCALHYSRSAGKELNIVVVCIHLYRFLHIIKHVLSYSHLLKTNTLSTVGLTGILSNTAFKSIHIFVAFSMFTICCRVKIDILIQHQAAAVISMKLHRWRCLEGLDIIYTTLFIIVQW